MYPTKTKLCKQATTPNSQQTAVASCGVYAHRKFCGNFKVLRPFELLCSPARTPSRQPSDCLKTYLSSLRIEYLKSISDRGTNKAALKNTF